MALNDYPIDVRVDHPERSSRGWAALTILLIKFLALIPHFFVLVFLGIAQFVVALIAQVAVAIKGEYPAGMFEFVAGVLRWSTRVSAFILSLSDRYPPFSLEAPTQALEPPLPAAPLPPAPLPPAQWYADPSGRHTHRYWDGAQWTEHVADDGRAASDPIDGPGSGLPG